MAAIFPPRWSWRMFGVFEPLTCLISGLMISMPAGDSIFLQSLFPAALRGASVAADPGSWWTYAVLGVAAVQDPAASVMTVTLTRMYASALICFALAQHFLWREWTVAGADSRGRLRAWAGLMLIPDLHHMLFAYGPYAAGPYAEWDAACYVHHALQIVLLLGRLVLLAASASGGKTGTGAVGAALQGALDAVFSSKVDRSLPADLRLTGVTIAVTGAGRGLGLSIAKALARRGANLIVLNRSLCDETVAALKQEPGADGTIRAVRIDLESVASVDAAVARLRADGVTLGCLVLNAGMLPGGARASKDGVDVMLHVNCLSSCRLVDGMLAHGVLAPGAAGLGGLGGLPRVVVVGSEAHRSSPPLALSDLKPAAPRWEYSMAGVVKYYGHSKLYLHTWASTLARKQQGSLDVFHLCPGAVATDIGREGPGWAQPLLKGLMALAFQPPDAAAIPAVWCAAHPAAGGRNGLYLHLGRERSPSPLASDEGIGDQLWDGMHELLNHLEAKAK